VDMEMVSRLYGKHTPALIRDGKLSAATIDNAVRRILRIKFRLGLFDKPYADETREQATLLSSANLAAAREVAARSIVLLKNERKVLPLGKEVRSIAVIGALAENQADMLGSWSGDGRKEDAVTLLEGIRAKVPRTTKVTYAKGCAVSGTDETNETLSIDEAVRAARESDVAIVAVGESADMSGEAASRASLDLTGRQLELVKAVVAVGKPGVIVLINGRPLTINWIADNAPAILETWFGGTQAGNAIADVLFG